MKIDFEGIEYDVRKGWHVLTNQPNYAVRAEHPAHRHIIGHGVGPDADTAKAAALKNLRALIVQASKEGQ